ncbi:FKBP-type peptidyl-prolyl cis-trans isomerase [Mucilaginibacter sp. FT3.2]|uniref:FKBP-type peptidyl-prolyl cis-trans isomerase n=1 Tax=Mucilaginibacter sp. FT3.2 TaxID=2723090 RepID=UPI00160D75CF|nr:FKBP-type peptidyl-prolyl cis-trans isomerase [Mucilaginibacter sp. FT3.2]MBB6230785.1 FKBP-type peptidyl-prolyl cis-trans isomerase FkpA [Mucilaginibacter sp. FT3.2]
MKNLVLLLFIASIAFASCSSGTPVDAVKQARIDDSIIRVYLSNNPIIKAVKDSSGLYYQVVKQGTGAYPTPTSTVTVNYRGKLINGAPFDSANGFNSPLGRLIEAWQTGIPHVKKGGNIRLFVPSKLGYGADGAGQIPANSVLVFDIDLIDFK